MAQALERLDPIFALTQMGVYPWTCAEAFIGAEAWLEAFRRGKEEELVDLKRRSPRAVECELQFFLCTSKELRCLRIVST